MSKEVIQKVEGNCVLENCVQVSIPYKENLIVFNKDGILYKTENENLLDERRTMYSRIDNGTSKYNYVQQIFNLDEPYVRVVDGLIVESVAVKDGGNAFLVNKVLDSKLSSSIMNRKEVDNLLKVNNGEQIYILKENGELVSGENALIPSEEDILKLSKKILNDQIEEYRDNINNEDLLYIENFKKAIECFKIEDLPSNLSIGNKNLLIIRLNGKDIKLEYIDIEYMSHDNYKVHIYNLPIVEYDLDTLKVVCNKFTEPSKKLRKI